MANAHRCPVCGYPGLEEPAYSATTGLGSYEICPSCGYEFGVTDEDEGISHAQWRRRWIVGGMQWWWTEAGPPEGWDPRAQLDALEG
ncbi:MAG: hypothetical protein ACRDQ5_20310 [Sciscionella sp.]